MGCNENLFPRLPDLRYRNRLLNCVSRNWGKIALVVRGFTSKIIKHTLITDSRLGRPLYKLRLSLRRIPETSSTFAKYKFSKSVRETTGSHVKSSGSICFSGHSRKYAYRCDGMHSCNLSYLFFFSGSHHIYLYLSLCDCLASHFSFV